MKEAATPEELEYAAAIKERLAGRPAQRENPLLSLGNELLAEFSLAQIDRRETEERWLSDLRQYKGQYEPEEELAMEGSKQFVRKTRVKVESVDARMTELLFPATRERNFAVDATPEPTVPPEKWREIRELLMTANDGAKPDRQTLKKAVRQYVVSAARKMGSRIEDQLLEAKYKQIARAVIHSGNLYGTGILKGPLVERRVRSSYVWSGKGWEYKTVAFAAPFVAHTPLWRFYPDMRVTDHRDCWYMWEHHRMTRSTLADLALRKSFVGEHIRAHINAHPDGCVKLMSYESDLWGMSDRGTKPDLSRSGQYDVFERWGWLRGEQLVSAGMDVPDDRRHEAFFANCWVLSSGEVIKAVLQPIDGVLYPYHWYYYDKDETSVFGEGLGAIMREDQRAINAAARMLLDNAAITSGPQFEVNLGEMARDVDLRSIHPRKIWPRVTGNGQYPAIRELRFDSHINELVGVIELFDQSADETTAIPKFTYGDNPKAGAAGTASGLSMLMGQANIAIKDQIANFDEVTTSFVTALYHWNMRYSKDPDIKGDFEVKATGASTLVAKEVRAQALAQYSGSLQPEERGFIKWPEFARMRAETMDLSGVVLDEDEVKEQQNSPQAQAAAQMQQMAQQLDLAEKQARVANLQAEAALKRSKDMAEKIEAIFAAMQGGATAVQNPGAAGAGDSILRSAGWVDATPDDGAAGAQQQTQDGGGSAAGQMSPEPTADPNTGQRAGIETVAIESPPQK